MNTIQILALVIFVAGYAAITFESQLRTPKAPTALLLGAALWLLATMNGTHRETLARGLEAAGAEIFGIVAFLLAAMTLVEILAHYRFFDYIRIQLNRRGYNDRQQFIVIGVISFFLSSMIDNLTTTIVMITSARRFFRGRNQIIVAAAIIIIANAGGAWSPIGDITTIMLWLANKFTALELIITTIVPSLIHALIAGYLLMRQLEQDTADSTEDLLITFRRSEFFVIALTLGSFGLPLLMSQLGLQPYMGLLVGLAVVWVFSGIMARVTDHETHLTADIEELLRKVDITTLQFFIGILLAVEALNALGVLENISLLLLGSAPHFERVMASNAVLGVLSAVVDNVPLTALAIDLIPVTDSRLWSLLAYCVGTGGSLLVIGSAAGVVAMGMVRELTSTTYFQIATKAVFLAYIAGIALWGLQVWIFGQ